MRCHIGDISFGSVLFANVIFAELSYLHDTILQLKIYLNKDNIIDNRFRKRR